MCVGHIPTPVEGTGGGPHSEGPCSNLTPKVGSGMAGKTCVYTHTHVRLRQESQDAGAESVGDEASCSLPKVYLYTLWSTCVHKPLRGD